MLLIVLIGNPTSFNRSKIYFFKNNSSIIGVNNSGIISYGNNFWTSMHPFDIVLMSSQRWSLASCSKNKKGVSKFWTNIHLVGIWQKGVLIWVLSLFNGQTINVFLFGSKSVLTEIFPKEHLFLGLHPFRCS